METTRKETSIIGSFVKTKSTGFLRYGVEQFIFLFLQMIPGLIGIFLRGIIYKVIIKSSGIFGIEENVQVCHAKNLFLGKNVFIGRNTYIGASDGGIELHDNVCLLDGCYLNVFNFDRQSCGRSKIIIEEGCVLSHGCVIHGHSGVQIGKNTIIGPNTVLISGGHGEIRKDSEYRYNQITINTPIAIGKNVWIGTQVTVMPGIVIGDNAVVGAGSVVTQNIPAYSVFIGNPARLLRMIE